MSSNRAGSKPSHFARSASSPADFRGNNSVPFPSASAFGRSVSGFSKADLESIGYSYPDAYSRLARNSVSLHHTRFSRSPAASTYSYRLRSTTQKLSPVAEETEDRRRNRWSRSTGSHSSPLSQRRSRAIPISVGGQSFRSDDTFLEDITIAMIAMRPDPVAEARKEALMRRAKPTQSRRKATYKTAKKVAGATRRAITSICKALPCLPWRHR